MPDKCGICLSILQHFCLHCVWAIAKFFTVDCFTHKFNISLSYFSSANSSFFAGFHFLKDCFLFLFFIFFPSLVCLEWIIHDISYWNYFYQIWYRFIVRLFFEKSKLLVVWKLDQVWLEFWKSWKIRMNYEISLKFSKCSTSTWHIVVINWMKMNVT